MRGLSGNRSILHRIKFSGTLIVPCIADLTIFSLNRYAQGGKKVFCFKTSERCDYKDLVSDQMSGAKIRAKNLIHGDNLTLKHNENTYFLFRIWTIHNLFWTDQTKSFSFCTRSVGWWLGVRKS